MKTHQTNKKKKIGTIYAAAMSIGLTPDKAKKLLLVQNATELRSQWDYRAYGWKIKDARAALTAAASSPSFHESCKENHKPYCYCPTVIHYLHDKEVREMERLNNLSMIDSLPAVDTIEDIKISTNGYGYGFGCVVQLEENFLVIKRIEEVTWSEKKSWKWPERRSTHYSISLISAAGDTLRDEKLENRTGDWLQKVGIALDLPTVTRTAVTQTGSMVPVRKFSKMHYVITELRLFGTGFTIYCVSKENFHFHASSPPEAIRGLQRKMRAHKMNLLDDDDVVTLKKVEQLGFCPVGIQEFLNELGWGGRKSATAGEIREAIRHIDVSPWVSELIAIGIITKPIHS